MVHDHPAIWTILQNERQSNLVATADRRASRLRRTWNVLRETWDRVRAIHATRRALCELNDHQLRDIGVEPGAIDRVARASVLAHLTVAGLDYADNRQARR